MLTLGSCLGSGLSVDGSVVVSGDLFLIVAPFNWHWLLTFTVLVVTVSQDLY